MKKEAHYERMKEEIPDDIDELPFESFVKTLEVLQKKPGHKYQFITSSGESPKAALFTLFQLIWKTEKIPKSWQESTVTQLFKGKGRLNDLSCMRHIHSRDMLGKFFLPNCSISCKGKLIQKYVKIPNCL